MKKRNAGRWVGVVCAVLWACAGTVAAQDEQLQDSDPALAETPVEEPVSVPDEVPAPPGGDAAPVLPAPDEEDAEDVPPVVAPVAPVKPPPAYRGAEMREAFKGAGSRYGVSGRVNKLPAKKAVKKPKEAWRFKLDLGMQTASGNSDTLRANGSASATKETDLHSYFLKSTGRYGESDKEKDAENATLEAKAQRRLSDRMYVAVDGHVLHDRIADLSYRARTSVSLGRHLVWTDRTVLSVEAGPGYVAERKGDDREGFMAGRLAQHLEFMVTDSLQIWQSLEYVPNLEDSRVYFVNAEVGLETVLVANLSLRFTVEDRYDSNPAEGKKNNDLLTTTALSWSF